jgi:hypothetical protein
LFGSELFYAATHDVEAVRRTIPRQNDDARADQQQYPDADDYGYECSLTHNSQRCGRHASSNRGVFDTLPKINVAGDPKP